MTITTTKLTRAAGLSAVVAGLLFIAVQINHPHLDLAFVTTTEWKVRQTRKVLFSALSLAGITGMYLRQVKQTGVLGLLGYLVFAVGFLIMTSIEIVGAVVLPAIAHSAPGYVNDVLAVATGGNATGDIGLMQLLSQLSGVGYVAGGPHLRHRAFPRQHPGPVGCGPPRRWHRRNPRDPPAAADQPKAVRHSHRRRPGRPRILAVARAAHSGRPARAQLCRLAARPGRRQVTVHPAARPTVRLGRQGRCRSR